MILLANCWNNIIMYGCTSIPHLTSPLLLPLTDVSLSQTRRDKQKEIQTDRPISSSTDYRLVEYKIDVYNTVKQISEEYRTIQYNNVLYSELKYSKINFLERTIQNSREAKLMRSSFSTGGVHRSHEKYRLLNRKTSLLRRLQAQTLPEATPPIGQIHPFNKMAINSEPLLGFDALQGLESS